MRSEQNSKMKGPVAFLPLLLGCTGLICCTVYEVQRTGFFYHSFYSFDRFIQHHLSDVNGLALYVSILGMLLGWVIERIRGRSPIVFYGTVSSLVALLW